MDKQTVLREYFGFRSFREGQEALIDALIESKKELAENVIGSGGEGWITEPGNAELMNILRLD